MALTTKLELRQSQQLVMTPQLQQAIRLLQLSNLELTQYVDIELERNPLLERVDTVDDGADSPAERGDRIDGQGDGDDYAASARSDNAGDSGLDAGSGTRDHDQGDNSPVEFGLGDRGGREANVAEGGPGIPTASDGEPGERIPEEGRAGDTGGDEAWLDLASPKTDAAAAFDTEYDNVYPDDSGSDSDAAGWAGLRTRDGSFGGDESNLEAYVAADLSLKDHLTAQLPLVVQDAAERLIGQYLIDLVDDAGYVPRDVDQISDKLGASPDMVEAVIVKMQAMDPPGCFARSLGECLALQLKDQNRYDPIIAALLDNLELLARHDLGALRRAVGLVVIIIEPASRWSFQSASTWTSLPR